MGYRVVVARSNYSGMGVERRSNRNRIESNRSGIVSVIEADVVVETEIAK